MKKHLPLTVCALVCLALFTGLGSFQAKAQQTVTETFSTSGTFTVPIGVTTITVQAWGGGGAGGNSSQPDVVGNARGGGGGGGGDYASATFAVTPGATYTVVVGARGEGAVTDNRIDGGASYISEFSSTIQAAGGRGGVPNTSGGNPAGGDSGYIGTTAGDFVTNGNSGSAGDTGIISVTFSGAGGDGGNGGTGGTAVGGAAPSAPGNPGVFPGAGGSGGYTVDGGVSQAGGNGADGQIIITYDCPAVVADGPDDVDQIFCDQGAVDTAFTNWLNEFTASGGCNLTTTMTPASPTAPNYCGGSITVEFEISSDLENFVISSTFTVTDNTPPEFSPTPGNLTADLPSTSCEVQVDWSTVNVTDECPIVTFTLTADPPLALTIGATETFGQFPPGVTTLVYFAEDVCGQTISHTFTVTVTDVDPPDFTGGTTADIEAYTDTDECFATVSWDAPEVIDNCFSLLVKTALIEYADGTTQTFSFTNNTTYEREYPVGTSTVTLSASDNDNTTTRSFNVTVSDNQPPVVTCPTLTNPYEVAAGTCSRTITLTATATDNCPGAPTIEYSYAGSAYVLTDTYTYPVGTTKVDVLVTDVNGVTSTCTYDVVVVDTTPPEVLVVASPLVYDLPDTGSIEVVIDVDDIDDGSNDPCGIPIDGMSLSQYLFTCAHVGDNEVILTVTDTYGNVATGSVTVTIRDVTPPTVDCPSTINALADEGVCTASVTFTATATDNCGTPEIRYYIDGISGTEISSPYAFAVGTTVVTVLAIDANTLTNTCTFDVVVTDNQKPTFTCPDPGSEPIAMDNGECYAERTFAVTDAADNCGTPVVEYSYGGGSFTPSATYQYPVGTTQVDVRVTDVNSNVATCTFNVVVFDDQKPVVDCSVLGTNGLVERTADPGACNKEIVLPVPIATDNCGINTYTFTSTASPTIDFSVYTNTGTGVVEFSATYPVGITAVTLTVQDVNGLIATCTFTVKVFHDDKPYAVTKNIPALALDADGNASITPADVNNGSIVTPGHCSFASWEVVPSAFACTDVGPNTVTLTITDKTGRTSSATAIVTVVNNQNPEFVTQNIDVELDANGDYVITDAHALIVDGAAGITHNCPIGTVTVSIYEFDCDDVTISPIEVTVTVTDINGNIGTETATVTVKDVTPPTLVADDITVQLDASGQYTITAMDVYDEGASGDNCEINTNTFTLSQSTFTCTDIGLVTVVFNGQDVHGNPSSDTFTVTVEDNIPPALVGCITSTIQVGTNSDCLYVHSGTGWNPGVTDNCTIASPTFELTGVTELVGGTSLDGVAFNLGTTYVTWSVTDAGGNTVSCTFEVEVIDDVPPVFTHCPGPALPAVTAGPGACRTTVEWDPITATDNCTGPVTITAVFSDGPVGFTPLNSNGKSSREFDVGIHTATFVATDAAGNKATCTFTITVHSNSLPVAKAKDIQVELDENGDASITVMDINDGSTIGCYDPPAENIADFLSPDEYNFDCDDVGPNTVTLTVTDKTGRTDTATAVVTVVNNQEPVITPLHISVTLDAGGTATITADDVISDVVHNCAIVDKEIDKDTFGCTDIVNGPVEVTITVTDINGKTATATAQVTVVDDTPPVLAANDYSVDLGSAGVVTITLTAIYEYIFDDENSSDACGIDTSTLSLSKNVFDCEDIGTHSITLYVDDINGNTASATFTLTVEDNEAPMFACIDNPAPVGVAVDACSYTHNNTDWDVTATDNCTTVITPTYALSGATELANNPGNTTLNGQAFGLGFTTVTWTVMDAAGNPATCTFVVEVVDDQPPVFSNCPGNQSNVPALSGTCNATVGWTVPSVTEYCGTYTLTVKTSDATIPTTNPSWLNQNNYHEALFPVGFTTVTYTAVDAVGNVSTCSFVIHVTDNQPPVARVRDPFTIELNDVGVYTLTTAEVDRPFPEGSSDNCPPIDYMTLSQEVFTCAHLGPNTVTLTVYDKSGLSHSASTIVTVVDAIKPVAIAKDIHVDLGPTGVVTITALAVNDDSTDNCGIVSYTLSNYTFTCEDIGLNTVTLTVTDQSGNDDTAIANVYVYDNTPPVLVDCVPGIQEVTTDNGNCVYTHTGISWDPTATDNCGDVTPTYSLSGDTTLANDDDNVSLDAQVFEIGTTYVTWWAFDGYNTSSCTFTVIVTDDEAPVLTCVGDQLLVGTDTDACHYTHSTDDWDPTVDDNCTDSAAMTPTYTLSGATETIDGSNTTLNGQVFQPGITTVTWSVTDASGNPASCTFIVEVVDDVPPVLSNACPEDRYGTVMNCNAKYFSWTAPDFADNCDGVIKFNVNPDQYQIFTSDPHVDIQTSAHPSHGATFPVGITTVYYVATDVAGNVATCSFTVTVDDGVDPTVIAKDEITVQLNADGFASITPEDVDNGSSDNCDILYMEVEPNIFGCAHVGIPQTVTLTVYDLTMRSATATTIVYVEDNVAPVVTVTPITVQLDATGVATITYSDVASATDACGIQTETISPDRFTCAEVGEQIVTVTVTDNNDNVTTETVTVTVEDTIEPVLTLNDLTVYLDANGVATITFADVASADDACGVATETLSRDEFGCDDVNGVVLVDVIAWDNNGNQAVGTVSITVIDNIPPTIVCRTATETFAYADIGMCTYTVTTDEFDPDADDNCSFVVTHNYAPAPLTNTLLGAAFPVGDTEVVWTVTDASGHQASCTITVRIRDNQLPSFMAGTFPASSKHEVPNIGVCALLVSWNNPVPTDNCGVETMTLSWESNNSTTTSLNIEPDGSGKTRATFPAGVTTMTYTVLDIHGNSYARSFTVTILDKDKPTAIAKNIDVFLNNDGLATITAEDVDDGSSDICGDVILSVYPSVFDCTQANEHVEVTLTVTDLSGNIATTTATVSVYDNVFPTIACVTDTYRVNDAGLCSYEAKDGEFDPVAWDNCPEYVVTHDYTADVLTSLDGAVFPVGPTTVTWTVVDASGNTASCTIVVVVEDTEVPTIAAVSDQNKNTDPYVCNYTVQGIEFDPEIFGDNCPGAFIVHDYGIASDTHTLAGAVFPKGSTVVVWTVTDAVGLFTTTMFTVTVTDNELPSIACATDTFRYNDPGECFYTAKLGEFDPVVDDNCAVATVTNTFNGTATLDGEVFPVGTTVVTWYVTDTSGNVNSCTMTIEVRDNEPPVFVSFPADKQLGSSSAENCEADWVWDVPVADDNCEVVTSTLTRWWTSTNPTANITWKDYNTVPPQTEATFPVGVTTVYYSIGDIYGNVHTQSFTVTVDDNALPVIVKCPEDRDIEGCTVADIDNPPFSEEMTLSDYDTFSGFDNKGEAYDNCGEIAQVWYQDVITNPTCEIVVERTWYIVDFSFNTVSCTQTIRINEEEAPTLAGTLPGGHVGDDVCIDSRPTAPAAVDIAALYTDNCTVTVTATYDGETLEGTDCGWTVTYTYTVSDECGNTTPAVVVYWGADKEAPTLATSETCASLNISAVNDCLANAEAWDATQLFDEVAALYEDNCTATLTVTLDDTAYGAGNTDCAWIITYTFKVEDDCENATYCEVTRSGGDTENPELKDEMYTSAELNISLENDCLDNAEAWDAAQLFDEVAALYKDNCTATLTVTLDNTAYGVGNTDCAWIITYTFKVADDCGNHVFCEVSRSGGDTGAPVVDNRSTFATEYSCDRDVPAPNENSLSIVENCSAIVSITLTTSTRVDGSCPNTYTLTRKWRVEDECENVTLFDQVINVVDTDAPYLESPTLTCTDLNKTDVKWCWDELIAFPASDLESEVAELYTDNCGVVTATWLKEETVYAGSDCGWTATFTFQISDECDNSVYCTVVYTGGNSEAPRLVGTVPAGETDMPLCVTYIPEGPTEAAIADLYEVNCGVVTATKTTNLVGDDCSWTVTYTYVASDLCGQEAEPVYVVYSGGDSEAPQLVGTITQTVFADLNLCLENIPEGPSEEDIAALYTDNCGDVNVTKSGTPSGTDCAWIVTYTYTITDDCRNDADPIVIVYSGGDSEAPKLLTEAIVPVGETGMHLCFNEIPVGPTEADITALFTDNCGEVNVVKSGEPIGNDCSWIVTYTYTITDDCNNSATPIVIVYSGGDSEEPKLRPTADVPQGESGMNLCYANIPEGPTAAAIADLFTDNCGVVSVTKTTDAFGDDCAWVVTYTYTIVDDCQNYATPIVIVYSGGDSEEPKLLPEASVPVGDTEMNLCYANIPEGPTAAAIADLFADNCGVVSVTKTTDAFGDDCAWVVTYTYTIVDDCQNYATPIVIVYSGGDSAAPEISGEHCGRTTPVEATVTTDCSFVADTSWDVTATDNCGAVTLRVKLEGANTMGWTVTNTLAGKVFETGLTTITWEAEDGCGLITTCTFEVMVTVGPPTFSTDPLPGDQIVDVDNNDVCTYTLLTTDWDVAVYDPCSVISLTYELSGATEGTGTSLQDVTFNCGVTTVTWTATDGVDVISHTFTVTVRPLTLSGIVSYIRPNDPDLMLDNVVVRLLDTNGDEVASTTTDGDGYYEFAQEDVMGASFMEVHTTRPHAGLTAGDAYAIVVRALNDGNPTMYPPYWTPQLFIDHVANVLPAPIDPGVTIDDAFIVYARHTRKINFFPAGDWAFFAPMDETLFSNTNANTARRSYGRNLCKMDIHVRAFGDVRGSYTPSSTSAKSLVPVQTDQVMRIGRDAEFELPITLTQPADYNAVSVYLDYDASKIEVLEVMPSVPDMFISIEDGSIRVEWYGIETVSINDGEALFTLVARPLQDIRRNDMLFSLDHRTEFIDVRGLVIDGIDLTVSSLDTSDDVVGILDPAHGDISLNAFPNPFRNELTLSYHLDNPGTVRITMVNMIGAVVAEMVNHQHEQGTHTHVFNPKLVNIDYGVYFVRMEVKGVDSFSSRYVKLVYIR